MFRRLPHTLPADVSFEPDLTKLGFFINGEDQVRSVRNPARKFTYLVNRNERWNQVHKGANNAAVRKIVTDRLHALGLETIRLPLGAAEQDNHVPILVSKDIASKDRVIIFFGERNVEPGILSWRVIGDEGIKRGSLIEFAEAILSTSDTTPATNGDKPGDTTTSSTGLIVANPSQLLWYRGGGRAVSNYEWLCLPRPSAVHDAPRIDVIKNRIPGNHDYEQHVAYIFDKVVPSLVSKDAKLDVIGVEFTGKAVLEYLAENWNTWSSRLDGIALLTPQHKIAELIVQSAPSSFINFLSTRCRAYFVSPSSIETPVTGREDHGCNCYASGEHSFQESAIVRSWRRILDWFDMLHVNPMHEEVEFEVIERAEEVKLGW